MTESETSAPSPSTPASASTGASTDASTGGPEVMHCTWHPDRETVLRCARCGRPMCPACATPHPVGMRCKQCFKETRSPLYRVEPRGYAIGGAVGLVASIAAAAVANLACGLIGGFFQLFVAFILGSSLGTGIGDVIGRAAGRKRGRGLMAIAGGAVILGVAIVAVVVWQLGGLRSVPVVGLVVYAVLATSAAAARLR